MSIRNLIIGHKSTMHKNSYTCKQFLGHVRLYNCVVSVFSSQIKTILGLYILEISKSYFEAYSDPLNSVV